MKILDCSLIPHSTGSCSKFLTYPTHWQTIFYNFILNFYNFIVKNPFQMLGNCQHQYQQIQLVWRFVHHQCLELHQFTLQFWKARLKALLHLLLPPQVNNHFHFSKSCLDHHWKWSRSDFQGHTAQSYQHHLQSWKQWPQWSGHRIILTSDFLELPLLNYHSCKSMVSCNAHMMISDPQG